MPPRRCAAVLLVVALASCSSGAPDRAATPTPTPSFDELEPYPFTTPTPPDVATPLDGVYERAVTEDVAGPPGKCRRCPPYRMELGDTHTLTLERGEYRITHELGWRISGHYVVNARRLTLFNDPNCSAMRGTYEWRVSGDVLTFEVLDDACPFGNLRSRYLTATPWQRVA